MAEDLVNFDDALRKACHVFGVPKLFPEQEKALRAFISRKDLLINLPTGYGKSLVFQMAPVVHEELSKNKDGFTAKPIVIVISPLISLMEDQVNSLTELKIKAAAIGDDKAVNTKIENGEYSVVFTSPESLLGNGRWRSMLSSDIYKKNLIGIVVDEAHCISHWGTSKSQDAVAFRRWFFKLSELRSLVSNTVPFMAVTATATRKTKDTIISVLRLEKFVQVSESPNKANIAFRVQAMVKQNSLTEYFQWLLDEVKEKGALTERTIIYYQTVKQCSTLYSLFVQELGDGIFVNECKDPRERFVEMLHALSSKSNKEVVLSEMNKDDGLIRVLICTIAFGMGVNCKGVRRVIHFGPYKTVEAYIQETGRAGRDGRPSKALLLYQSLMLLHVEQDIKDYIKGKYECRRKFLLGHFDEEGGKSHTATGKTKPVCCDMYSKDANLTVPVAAPAPHVGKTRSVSSEEKETLRHRLITLRKSLYSELLYQSPKGELPVSTVPELLIGFSDQQISQVLESFENLFSISDVKTYVEIWKERHAHAIMDIISDVFQDTCIHREERQADDHGDYFDGDDEEDDYWNELFSDTDLMDVDWNDFSASNIDDASFLEESQDLECSVMGVPELGDLISRYK